MKVLLLAIKQQKANLESFYQGMAAYAELEIRIDSTSGPLTSGNEEDPMRSAAELQGSQRAQFFVGRTMA